MSLYGPKINLPKVNVPSPSNPSWNLEKEKKLAIVLIIAIVIIAALYLALPAILQSLGSSLDSITNPALRIDWKNNPLDVSKDVKNAEMDIVVTNTKKEAQTVSLKISTSSDDIIILCPTSHYDTNLGAYILENISPGDKRIMPCVVRRNPNAAVFSGTYTLDVNSSIGETKTTLEIITNK